MRVQGEASKQECEGTRAEEVEGGTQLVQLPEPRDEESFGELRGYACTVAAVVDSTHQAVV
eukprot:5300206-Amphidinium_carterae.1